MGKLTFHISVSLDGYIAGPDPSLEEPLGKGGEKLHEWALRTEAWRAEHGYEGGEHGVDSDVIAESTRNVGAYVMGRKMFSGGEGGWEDDPRASGWWGDTPPFGVPVFVLTHHAREPLEMQGGTTFHFVTDGIDSALEQARAAAGDRDVSIAGGGEVVQQALRAGQVDDFQIHLAPVMLGAGTRLFEGLPPAMELEPLSVAESPAATHIRYRVS
jgi:dihydrofolate reductase